MRGVRCALVLAALGTASCSSTPEPVPIEFGYQRFLDPPVFVELGEAICTGAGEWERRIRANLPDTTWFEIVAVYDPGTELASAAISRGEVGGPARVGVTYDRSQGLVHQLSPPNERWFSLDSPRADWVRDVAAAARMIPCSIEGAG